MPFAFAFAFGWSVRFLSTAVFIDDDHDDDVGAGIQCVVSHDSWTWSVVVSRLAIKPVDSCDSHGLCLCPWLVYQLTRQVASCTYHVETRVL